MDLASRTLRAALAAGLLLTGFVPAFASPLAQGLAAASEDDSTSESSASPRAARPLPAGAFESVLPADTVLWIGVDRVDALRRDFTASAMGRVLGDEALAPMRAALSAQLTTLRAHLQTELGADPVALLEWFDGPAALAVSLPGGAPGAGAVTHDGEVPVLVLLLADVGSHERDADALLDRLMERLASHEGGLQRGERQVAGFTLNTLSSSRQAAAGAAHSGDAHAAAGAHLSEDAHAADDAHAVAVAHAADAQLLTAPEGVLSWGFRGPLMVVAFEWLPGAGDALTPVLAAFDEPREARARPTLASRADFTGSFAATPGHVRTWADVGGAVRLVTAANAASGADPSGRERDAVQALGLHGLGTFSQSLSFGAAGSEWSAGLTWAGTGWIPSLMRQLCRTGEPRTPELMPADCLSASVAHLDPAGIFDDALSMLMDLKVASPSDITSVLISMERTLGFNLRDEALELLDGEFGFVSLRTDVEEAFPGMALDPQNFGLLVGLNDGAEFAALVDAAIEGSGLRAARRREDFHGLTIDHITLMAPLALHYVILDDVLLASQSTAVLHEMLARHRDADLPSLASLPAFRDGLARLPAPHGMLSYSDTAGQLQSVVRSLQLLPEILRNIGVGIRQEGVVVPDWLGDLGAMTPLDLSDTNFVREHVTGPTLTNIVVDDRGVRLFSIGP